MELCPYCSSGRVIQTEDCWVCNNCGVVTEEPEDYSRQPRKLSHTELKRKKDKEFQSYIKKKERQRLNKKALELRNEQRDKIEYAIDNICSLLGLDCNKVLARFYNRLKNLKVNEILNTSNIITNKGHRRGPNVVAAGLIYKVYRNKVTIKRLREVTKCGGKPLNKILRIL